MISLSFCTALPKGHTMKVPTYLLIKEEREERYRDQLAIYSRPIQAPRQRKKVPKRNETQRGVCNVDFTVG